MTIEELFGTLQMSVVAGWRKHLRSAKYSKHMALDEFYKEMPDKVDDLIEAWMGAHGKKVGNFTNILTSSNLNTLKYLTELKRVCKEGRTLMGGNDELNSLLDDIVNLINSTLYKVKELSESEIMDLKDFINEALVSEAKEYHRYSMDTREFTDPRGNEFIKIQVFDCYFDKLYTALIDTSTGGVTGDFSYPKFMEKFLDDLNEKIKKFDWTKDLECPMAYTITMPNPHSKDGWKLNRHPGYEIFTGVTSIGQLKKRSR